MTRTYCWVLTQGGVHFVKGSVSLAHRRRGGKGNKGGQGGNVWDSVSKLSSFLSSFILRGVHSRLCFSHGSILVYPGHLFFVCVFCLSVFFVFILSLNMMSLSLCTVTWQTL